MLARVRDLHHPNLDRLPPQPLAARPCLTECEHPIERQAIAMHRCERLKCFVRSNFFFLSEVLGTRKKQTFEKEEN